jgi:PAS domain S-box-containing protein
MNDINKTNEQLLEELRRARRIIAELESSKSQYSYAEDEHKRKSTIDDNHSESPIRHARIDESFKRSNEKFAKAFLQNSVPMAISTIKEGRYVDVSDAFLELMGLSRGEVIGNTSIGVGCITREQRSIVLNEISIKGRAENLELQVRTRGGEIRHGLFNSAKIQIAEEEYLLTVVTDITEQKQAENALRKSEDHFRRLMNNIPGAVYQFYARQNGEMGLYYVSERAFELLGLETEPQDFFQRFRECVAPEDREAFLESINDAISSISKWDYEVKFIKPTGEEMYVRGISQPIQYENEIVFDGVLLDITARRLAEKALCKSEAKYRFLTEKMNDIIWTADLDFHITYDSPSVEKALGFTLEERMGQTASEMLTPESYTKALHVLRAELERDQEEGVDPDRTIKLELEYYHKNGSTVWMECIVSGIRNDSGSILGLHGVSRNISDRKRVELELKKHRDQLENLIDERTSELTKAYEKLKQENEIRKTAEIALKSREIELEKGRRELEEMNSALKVLLKQRESDKVNMEMNIISNIKTSVLPYIDKLESSGLSESQMRALLLMKSLLGDITSPFIRKVSSEYLGFTPHEIQVASLIKEGKSSKEIAELLNISLNTVHTYRYKIRIKTGLKNNKVNLRSYLQTLG